MRLLVILLTLFSLGCSGVTVDTFDGLKKVYPEYDNIKFTQGQIDTFQIKRYIGNFNYFVYYKRDYKVYGHKDYWQTPGTTLTNWSGDCEDTALVEMVAHYTLYNQKGYIYLLKGEDEGHAVFGVARKREYGDDRIYVSESSMEGKTIEQYMEYFNYTYIGRLNYSQALYTAYVVKTPVFISR